MAPEALPVVERVEPRRLDRFLGTHVEHGDVQEHLQGLLVLAVAAGAAQREERLAVAEHDRGAQGGARPLAALELVRPLVQREGLHPVAQRDARVACDEDAAIEPRRRGGSGEEVPPRVGDVHGGGVRRRPGRGRVGSGQAADNAMPRRCACPWLELPGIAGARAVARRERVDEGSALGGVGVGQETADGDLRELRVAIEVIPVRERQLERLRDGVDVLRGVVAHPLEIEAPKERERLEEDRPLAPEPGLEDLEGAMPSREAAARGSFHATTVARQVRFGQDAAGLLNGPGDALGDVTAIEAIARGVDRLLASAVQVLLLRLDERPEGAGEIRLAEHAPLGDGIVMLGPCRYTRAPLGNMCMRSSSGARKRLRKSYHGNPSARAIAGSSTSRSDSVPNSASAMASASTTAGTVPADGPAGGIRCAARRVSTDARRRRALAVDHDHVVPVGEVEDDRHFAAEPEVRDLGDGRREGRRHSAVHCGAASRQHPHRRLRREMATGRPPRRHARRPRRGRWTIPRYRRRPARRWRRER